ncbi:MAG: hypothetical protein NC925_05490, partial [Candidatus Omnitrophica bacterium]|nr:hypothetical protein [Candidatus Omnitrophota bacterium]
SLQNFLLLSYGLDDWFCIDLKAGMGYIKQKPSGYIEIDYPESFAGGYGFRVRLYNKGNFKSVFGFQHISVHPRKTKSNNDIHRAIFDDW